MSSTTCVAEIVQKLLSNIQTRNERAMKRYPSTQGETEIARRRAETNKTEHRNTKGTTYTICDMPVKARMIGRKMNEANARPMSIGKPGLKSTRYRTEVAIIRLSTPKNHYATPSQLVIVRTRRPSYFQIFMD